MTDDVALAVTRGGEVTDPEMAAIAAAASALLLAPRAVVVRPEPVSRWRFSGRWWVKPVPLRRRRP
ncbi:MAG TPA: hypothetical protein VFN21_13695 [Acidimicrobiales bacterium]|nr:hypothetical protein [Acidimicrobiales bacterium]